MGPLWASICLFSYSYCQIVPGVKMIPSSLRRTVGTTNEGRGRGAQNVNWWRSTTSDCPTVSLGLLHHHHHRYHQYNHHQPHSSLNIHNVGNLQRYFRELSLLLWDKFKVRLRSDHGQYKLNFFWQSKAAREKLLSFRKFHIKGLYFLQKLSFFRKADFGILSFFL